MNVLVDGHNLIGQMPHISLADQDDEAQLVLLLRRYATARRGRQVVVVFDHGVYGHPERLDGYGVTCYFARSPQDADAQLIQRVRAIQRPQEWTLVTSDRRVAQVAAERGMRVISSHAFAAHLLDPGGAAGAGSGRGRNGGAGKRNAAPGEERRDIRLSEAEVQEWLRIFGVAPEEAGEPPPPPSDDKTGPRPPKRGRRK